MDDSHRSISILYPNIKEITERVALEDIIPPNAALHWEETWYNLYTLDPSQKLHSKCGMPTSAAGLPTSMRLVHAEPNLGCHDPTCGAMTQPVVPVDNV